MAATFKPPQLSVGGVDYHLELETIERTFIGHADGRPMSFNIDVASPGSGQGTGHRFFTPSTYLLIDKILDVVGADSWESLAGRRVWVLRRKEFGGIAGLANGADPRKHVLLDPEDWR